MPSKYPTVVRSSFRIPLFFNVKALRTWTSIQHSTTGFLHLLQRKEMDFIPLIPSVRAPENRFHLPLWTSQNLTELQRENIMPNEDKLGLYSLRRRCLTGIGIPIINLRRSDDCLRFIMGIPILIRRRLLVNRGPDTWVDHDDDLTWKYITGPLWGKLPVTSNLHLQGASTTELQCWQTFQLWFEIP